MAIGILATGILATGGCGLPIALGAAPTSWLATDALAAGDAQVYVTCPVARCVLVVDATSGGVLQPFDLSDPPSGIAYAGGELVLTCSGQPDYVVALDPHSGRERRRLTAGAGACSPVVSQRSGRLFVCDRFDGTVSALELATGRRLASVPVLREPVPAALTPNEELLLVANLLPAGPANVKAIAVGVTVIDTVKLQVRTNILLPAGCVTARGIAVSPDGRYCAVVHNLARFQVPTTQVEHGWMNDSALTLIDVARMARTHTVLLDDLDRGAANPWAVAWARGGNTLCITHSGSHELSVIDTVGLFRRLAELPEGTVVEDLALLRGLRQRVRLKGNGPRALVVVGDKAYVAERFSDSLSVVDLDRKSLVASYRLGGSETTDSPARGEQLFHDATLSHQSWQSCASCHPDARVDGLNWDLLNDGIGNPKNTKSLLLAHGTPPAMSHGIRDTAEKAVRSGFRNILFAACPETDAAAVDEYLKSLRPIPSPHLENGRLSAAAERGRKLFEDGTIGCAKCHPSPLYTDLKSHDVGTANDHDRPKARFDTPTLVECWRTGPYLHDGSAATIREVLTGRNRGDRHGVTSGLSSTEIEELAAFVLSL